MYYTELIKEGHKQVIKRFHRNQKDIEMAMANKVTNKDCSTMHHPT